MEAIVQAKVATTEFAAHRDDLELVRAQEISNDEEKELAAQGLRLVKQWLSEVEEKRTAITGPLNKALREVNELFRPMKRSLEEAERDLKSRIAGYLAESEAKNLRAIQAAAAAETPAQANEALATVARAELPRGISQRFIWVFEIVDASQIPREYLTPDMVKIGEAVRARDGKPDIPGIVVRKESVISSRRA